MTRLTKKDLAVSLHDAGRSIPDIAAALECNQSYVANVLTAAGKQTEPLVYGPRVATASMQTPEAGALVEREIDGDTANLIIQHMKLQEANRVLLAACVNALRDWPIEYMEGDRARRDEMGPRCGDRINELRAAIQRAETLR